MSWTLWRAVHSARRRERNARSALLCQLIVITSEALKLLVAIAKGAEYSRERYLRALRNGMLNSVK